VQTLIVAAGGGGDAITGAALAGILGLTRPPVVMTYSWDRLMIDPVPGPRTASDFTGLRRLAPGVVGIDRSTRPVTPAGSSLPRLAAELPGRLILLDPIRGAVGMAEQITATADYFGLDAVALIDVGGDVLTDGTDPGLRSPLADQLALAACVRSSIPTRLIVAGPGLDGEIPADIIAERIAALDPEKLPNFGTADVDTVKHVFAWHPSEASGLLAAAASGLRGKVEVRDAGDQVALLDSTTSLAAVDARRAAATTPAGQLDLSTSLDQAAQIIRASTGTSEIEYETRKARRRADQDVHYPVVSDLDILDLHVREACERGADFISVRRLAEVLGATTLDAYAALIDLLRTNRPGAFELSAYRTNAQ
jgi:hypothetical protein